MRLVTVFIFKAKLVYAPFEEERGKIVDQTEEEKVDAEENACGSEVGCSILGCIVDRRAEIDLVHNIYDQLCEIGLIVRISLILHLS